MRQPIAALLLVLVLTSCQNKNPFVSNEITQFAKARVVAVTLPESLLAGTSVPVQVHWWRHYCTERLYLFEKVKDGPRHWTVTMFGMTLPNRGCIGSNPCVSLPDTFEVIVPAAGIDSYTVVGASGSIAFEVAAGIHANDPGHRVTLLDRATSAPLAGVQFKYDDWSEGVPIDSAKTDGFGFARVAPPPCGTGRVELDLEITGYDCGEGVLRFDGRDLCGRALHTIMLYGPFPPEAVSSPATLSM